MMKRRLMQYLWKTQAAQGEEGVTAGDQVDRDYWDREVWGLLWLLATKSHRSAPPAVFQFQNTCNILSTGEDQQDLSESAEPEFNVHTKGGKWVIVLTSTLSHCGDREVLLRILGWMRAGHRFVVISGLSMSCVLVKIWKGVEWTVTEDSAIPNISCAITRNGWLCTLATVLYHESGVMGTSHRKLLKILLVDDQGMYFLISCDVSGVLLLGRC